MRTTIDLPDELLKRAKIKAVQDGITLKQLFIKCLEQELEGSAAENVPTESQQRPSFRSALSSGSKLNINPNSSGFGDYKGPK